MDTEVPVESVRTVGPDTVALELATPEGFEALPGQFVLVRADLDGEEHSRYYTISSPDVLETFELTVGVDPEGTLSPWLAERDAGDPLRIEGPFGNVAYDADDDGDVLVLAGGPGVGPAVGVAEAATRAGHAAAVVYEDDEPAHEDRLSALAADGAGVHVVSQAGFDGAVADAAAGAEGVTPYVFGFQEFVDRALEALAAAGVDPDDAEVESFG